MAAKVSVRDDTNSFGSRESVFGFDFGDDNIAKRARNWVKKENK